MEQEKKIRIALFASGAGSNVFNIIQYFKKNSPIEVCLVLSNKKNAGALQHTEKENIKALSFNNADFFDSNNTLNLLKKEEIDVIILAGFLWKIPENLLEVFPNKIINIHPSLLPKYGGKGMYGRYVHEAVLANKEAETGITIHLVNEKYDEGKIIKQFTCKVEKEETLATLQQKISALEKKYFPITIEQFITQK